MKKSSGKVVRYNKWGYIFLIPFIVVYVIFQLIPLISTIYNSFFENYMSGLTQVGPNFVGLANYKKLFSDGDIWIYTKNTMLLWIMCFIPQIILSLVLGAWFSDVRLRLKGTRFFKTVVYLPNLIMASAFSMLFFTLFSDGGPINSMLMQIGFIDTPYKFLSNAGSARGLIALMNCLMWFGNTTILLMAGMMGIDTSLFEAAEVDGATSSQVFWQITLPLLRPILVYVVITSLIGGLLTIELGIPGWGGFLFAIVSGSALAAVCGYLYALMLNRLKGSEMSVTTYVGFSIVSLMCIAWLVLPFKSLKLRWPLGTGLRNTIGLDGTNFRHILNDFLAFQIGDFTIPTGLLLFMLFSCFVVWMFSRSRTGQAMQAVGNNPRFAESVGINVDKMRIIGTVFSTVLGAVGILVYSQSYGFMQLYTAPRQMGFIAASAILIGGASTSRCKISHVLIGTFLFQGVLTLGMPVANVLVPGSTISETLRILISNGIILYALTKSGGESRA